MQGPFERFDLTGKTAVVTGCRRGIGRAMALGLARHGADIVGIFSRSGTSGEIEEEVRALGRRLDPVVCDFTDQAAVAALAGSVMEGHGVPDILINNAGTIRRKAAVEHDDALWDEVMEVNLRAPFVLARDFGRAMVARGSGKILFIASLLTFQGGVTVPGYAASKGGLGQLTKALANEWAGSGVNVNAIAPGYIATDNTRALQADPVRSRQILDRIPAGRWGSPDDIVGPAVFLVSAAANYVHGEILVVDGGWMGR